MLILHSVIQCCSILYLVAFVFDLVPFSVIHCSIFYYVVISIAYFCTPLFNVAKSYILLRSFSIMYRSALLLFLYPFMSSYRSHIFVLRYSMLLNPISCCVRFRSCTVLRYSLLILYPIMLSYRQHIFVLRYSMLLYPISCSVRFRSCTALRYSLLILYRIMLSYRSHIFVHRLIKFALKPYNR